MWHELRYAARSILRAPGFTTIAVATLTFGVAVNTIVFTLLNSLTLRPIPAPNASRITFRLKAEATNAEFHKR
jgi:putative ABC transport system permease protein